MTIIILIYSGELPEKVLYHALKAYFCGKDESVVVFPGVDILKLNLEKFKITEKDFVIINNNRRCIIVIEVKKTLSHRDYLTLLTQEDPNHYEAYKIRRCFLWKNQYYQLDIYKDPCHDR